MRKKYDFSKSRKNPYANALKMQISIRLEAEVIDYFKKLSEESGISYQNLINMYLHDCVKSHKRPVFKWA